MQLGYCVYRSFIHRLYQLMCTRVFVASYVDRVVDWQHIGHTLMVLEIQRYFTPLAADYAVAVVFVLRIGSC